MYVKLAGFMEYRVSPRDLLDTLEAWDAALSGRGKIRLIACGGTALTLLGHKESTKDVDFLVPDEGEYKRLIGFLKQAGYGEVTAYGWKRSGENMVFDLYPGRKVYSTELLSSPLARGGHKKIRDWRKIYLGVLNPADLIISKMFRGTEVDIGDSLVLLEKEKVDLKKLEKRYRETAGFDVSEERVLNNFTVLMKRFRKFGGR